MKGYLELDFDLEFLYWFIYYFYWSKWNKQKKKKNQNLRVQMALFEANPFGHSSTHSPSCSEYSDAHVVHIIAKDID